MRLNAYGHPQRMTRPCGAQMGLVGAAEDGVSVAALLLRLAGSIWSGRIRFRSPLSPRATWWPYGYGEGAHEPWSSWHAGREAARQRHAALDAAMKLEHRHPMDWADYTFNAVRYSAVAPGENEVPPLVFWHSSATLYGSTIISVLFCPTVFRRQQSCERVIVNP